MFKDVLFSFLYLIFAALAEIFFITFILK